MALNFSNLIGDIGSLGQGYQQGQDQAQKRQMLAMQQQQEALKLQQIKDQIARDPLVAKTAMDFLSQKNGMIPPPPQQNKPPMPGQASQPMAPPGQPPAQPQMQPSPAQPQQPLTQAQPQQSPPMGQVPGMPPLPAAMNANNMVIPPQVQQQRDQQRLQILHQELQTEQNPTNRAYIQKEISRMSGIPPYRAMPGSDQQQDQPQTQQGSIPPPPAQQGQQPPAPNSMSIDDAAKFIKGRGIDDPIAAMQVLERLTPYLNNVAKQEAAQYKAQLAQMQAAEKSRHDQAMEGTAQQRADTAKEDVKSKVETRPIFAGAASTNASANKTRSDATARDAGGKLTPEAIDYWRDVLRYGGSLPPRMGKGDIAQIVEGVATGTGKISPKEMLENKSDQAGITSEKRALGTQVANVNLAGGEFENASKIAKTLSDKYDRTSFPGINKALNAFETQKGDPNIRAFGAAINTAVNSYARAINPKGVGTVSDKEHARELLSTADSKESFDAVMAVLDQEVEKAKTVGATVKGDLRKQNIGSSPAGTVNWSDWK